ncbi:hypothetical protein [Bacillus benzoevorans]|uniref:Uncharacterized protein n=1 Tax=Bacillus benzoevorans TaxID=1456 RepID=A0A7X0HUG2_9BACI|nr:hypothetical protein [Bacillus benzoevorans]MBB6447069.1 hypothetical protein [Bacillus benzoevorans]
MIKATVSKGTKVAKHYKNYGGYSYKYFVLGRNPFGVKGGQNGSWVEGEVFGEAVQTNSIMLYKAENVINKVICSIPNESIEVEIEWEKVKKIAAKRKEETFEAALNKYLRELLNN